MDRSLVPLSRFISLVLRHDPGHVGLRLDEEGWTDIDELLAAAARAGKDLTRPLLERIVAENDKQRFRLSPDGRRIRANQGHSIPVDLGLAPQVPPETLFHGTARRFLESIREHGLIKGKRHQVHLSADPLTAHQVGGRHGPPVILRVAAGRMHAASHVFFRSANGVWLTDHVPPSFLEEDTSNIAR